MAWTATSSTVMDLPNGAKVYEGYFDAICGNFADIAGTTGLGWVTWTPTVDQTGAVAVTVNFARYMKINKSAFVRANVTANAAGGGAAAIDIAGWPAAINPVHTGVQAYVGSCSLEDAGTAQLTGSVVAYGATVLRCQGYAFFTLASSDDISINCAWETT